MSIIFFLLPATILLALLALVAYVWCARSGQYEDLDTPPLRMLTDDLEERLPKEKATPNH